jgi:hypothetical protein
MGHATESSRGWGAVAELDIVAGMREREESGLCAKCIGYIMIVDLLHIKRYCLKFIRVFTDSLALFLGIGICRKTTFPRVYSEETIDRCLSGMDVRRAYRSAANRRKMHLVHNSEMSSG